MRAKRNVFRKTELSRRVPGEGERLGTYDLLGLLNEFVDSQRLYSVCTERVNSKVTRT